MIKCIWIFIFLGYPILSFAQERFEVYNGIGQVTVLHGQAVYLPFEIKIDTCLVRTGQYVQQNQALFSIDSYILAKTINDLEIEHLELKQNLYELEKNNLSIYESKVNLTQALQELEYAKKRWQDSEKLLQAGIISQEEYLWDKRRYQQSADHYKKQLILQKQVNNHTVYNEKVMLLNKKIKNSQHKIIQAKNHVKNPMVRANKKGLVLPVKLKSGEFYCQSGEKILNEQVILWLAPIENRRVELKLDQIDIYKVKVGNKAEIAFPAYGSQTIRSEVVEIDAMPEQNIIPAKYRVFLKMNSDEQIRLGTQARVKIYFDK